MKNTASEILTFFSSCDSASYPGSQKSCCTDWARRYIMSCYHLCLDEKKRHSLTNGLNIFFHPGGWKSLWGFWKHLHNSRKCCQKIRCVALWHKLCAANGAPWSRPSWVDVGYFTPHSYPRHFWIMTVWVWVCSTLLHGGGTRCVCKGTRTRLIFDFISPSSSRSVNKKNQQETPAVPSVYIQKKINIVLTLL